MRKLKIKHNSLSNIFVLDRNMVKFGKMFT